MYDFSVYMQIFFKLLNLLILLNYHKTQLLLFEMF